MPHLTFPIGPLGPTVSVQVGLASNALAALQASGRAIPTPLLAQGLIDTGTDLTAIVPSVLQRLAGASILPGVTAQTHTASGVVAVNLFEISLSIFTETSTAMLTRAQLTVTELASPLAGIDVLIGMDVLSECLLVMDGPARRFTLAF